MLLFCCVALPRQEKNDASGRKALLRERRVRVCMCVSMWVDVWPVSLASSPAPHVTHSLGPNVDQDRKTIKRMVSLCTTLNYLQNENQRK